MRIWIDRRGSRNTLRLGRADRVVRPYKPLDIGHVSNFIRQIFNGRKSSDPYFLSCDAETRFYGRPKGVRTTERGTKKRTTERHAFSRVSAISASCASFLHTFFWQDRKKYARGATVSVAQLQRHIGEYEKCSAPLARLAPLRAQRGITLRVTNCPASFGRGFALRAKRGVTPPG